MRAFFVTLAIGALAAGCATVVIPHATPLQAERIGVPLLVLEQGRGLFVARCGNCHQTPDPGSRNAKDWARILPEMLEDSHLNPVEAAKVLAFLQAMASDAGTSEQHAERETVPSTHR